MASANEASDDGVLNDTEIRLCHPDDCRDFTEIDRLERECAQGTLLRFYFAADDPRKPTPRAFKFPRHIVTIAESRRQNGRVVGTVSAVVREIRLGSADRIIKAGWVFSLRVGLNERRTGVATQLVVDMERRLKEEHGVEFIFDSVALDNAPSMRLFEKLGYNLMWKARFYGINVSHTNKLLVKQQKQETDGPTLQRLDERQSKVFLTRHYGRCFGFPGDENEIAPSNVHVACQGQDLVAVNLWKDGHRLGIVAIPFYLRLLYYIMMLLAMIFPNYFEKPLPLSRPWQMRWAYPIHVDVVSKDRHVAKRLFNAAVAQAVRECKSDGYDVLNMPAERSVSGVENHDLVKRCPFVSPLMRGTGGILQIGKSLLDDTDSAASLAADAANEPIWFLNNSL